MLRPSIKYSLLYAREHIDFYKSKDYADLDKKSKNLEEMLDNLPIISGESFFDNNFYNFVPHKKAYISTFLTSGSTGKPKVIPATEDDLKLLSDTFLNAYYSVIKAVPSIFINIAPPRPAISGVGMSFITMGADSIEINPGPGQTLFDSLKYAESILLSHPEMNKKIILHGLPSLMFKNIYDLKPEESQLMKNIAEKLDIYVAVGGEALDLERGKLLYSLLPVKGIFNLLASTERVVGYKIYSEEDLKNESSKDKSVFKLMRYNNEFGVLSDNKLCYPGDGNEIKGKTGELIITSTGFKGKNHVPLINYNMKEKVKFLDYDKDSVYMEFFGRTNKVTPFSVSKLNDLLIDNVLASTERKFGLGEGYTEITRENGLDKITFYFFKDKFNSDKKSLLDYVSEKLSEEEMEIKYVLEKKLGFLDVKLTDKESIPFYDKKTVKAPKIIDKRQLEHY